MFRRPQLPHAFMRQWPYKDQNAWSDALIDNGIFSDSSRATRWSKQTLYQVAWSYGQWINFCTTYFEDRDPEPADRVTGERLAAFVKFLERKGLLPSTIVNLLSHLRMALTAIAGDTDWSWMSESISYLRKMCDDSGRKAKILTIDSLALWDLGTGLIEEAKPTAGDSLERALLYRDGLMIALLSRRPIRLANLAMIRISVHLELNGSVWHLVFSAQETKQRRPYEASLPREFNDFFDRYLVIHRPRIGDADNHDFLWASAKGGGLCKDACADVVRRRTKAKFGFPISPHLFRDSAVNTIARYAPGRIGVASKVLGHSGPDVTEKHYNRARTLDAACQYGDFVENLRNGAFAGTISTRSENDSQ